MGNPENNQEAIKQEMISFLTKTAKMPGFVMKGINDKDLKTLYNTEKSKQIGSAVCTKKASAEDQRKKLASALKVFHKNQQAEFTRFIKSSIGNKQAHTCRVSEAYTAGNMPYIMGFEVNAVRKIPLEIKAVQEIPVLLEGLKKLLTDTSFKSNIELCVLESKSRQDSTTIPLGEIGSDDDFTYHGKLMPRVLNKKELKDLAEVTAIAEKDQIDKEIEAEMASK